MQPQPFSYVYASDLMISNLGKPPQPLHSSVGFSNWTRNAFPNELRTSLPTIYQQSDEESQSQGSRMNSQQSFQPGIIYTATNWQPSPRKPQYYPVKRERQFLLRPKPIEELKRLARTEEEESNVSSAVVHWNIDMEDMPRMSKEGFLPESTCSLTKQAMLYEFIDESPKKKNSNTAWYNICG